MAKESPVSITPTASARHCLAKGPHGPSLYHLMEVLGKDKVMGRIEKAVAVFGC